MKNRLAKIIALTLALALILTGTVFASISYNSLGTGKVLPTSESTINIDTNEFKADDIENISLVQLNTKEVKGVSFEVRDTDNGLDIVVQPNENIELDKKFKLRIFTKDSQYEFETYTDKFVDFDDYESSVKQVITNTGEWEDKFIKRIEIPANPSKGFYYPYFLIVPSHAVIENDRWVDSEEYPTHKYGQYLMAEGNNTSAVHSATYAEKLIETTYSPNIGETVATMLEMPYLMPAFPRPLGDYVNTYTHMLDEETLFMTQEQSDAIGLGNLVGLDKQFNAMIEDAKEHFKANGIILEEKIVMAGFSASAQWAQRYSMLYPEKVDTIVAGVPNPVLPLKEYNGITLNFPLGVNDYEEKIGKEFNAQAYHEINQFWQIGELDDNSILRYEDGFTSKSDRDFWINNFSVNNVEGWNKIIPIFNNLGSDIQFHTYKDIGHQITDNIQIDFAEFISDNLGKDSLTEIIPHVSGY